jgi:PKHD-type hydroxylase
MVWVYRRVTDIITSLNNDFFNFNLYGIIEGFQFTKYEAPGGNYGKHIDRAMGMTVRKLSLTIQLSESESYIGGDVLLHLSDNPTHISREQGTLVAFPSYTLHEVTPVTTGVRYSLVAWVTGPNFS